MDSSKEDEEALTALGQKLTHSGQKELDQKLLMKYEHLCEKTSSNMKSAFKQILEYLEKPHAEIRYGAFLLCDHLFRTYDNFRELMVEELPLLMVHSVGTEDAVPLPPPKPAAKALRQLALLSVLDWYHLYGPVHIELKMAYNFLRECFKVNFDAIERERAVEAARSMEAKSKMEAGKRQQLKKTLSEIKEYFSEIETCSISLRGCLEILLPPPEEFNIPGLGDDSATEDASRTVKVSMSSSVQVLATVSMGGICCAQFDLRDNGLLNRTHTVSFLHPAPTGIPTTEDNEQVIENARDAYRLIKKRYLPQVKMWQKVLDSNKDATCDKREVVSELLNALLKLVQQCKQLKLVENDVNSDAEDSSDEEFQEVEAKEGFEASIGDALLADMILQREQQRSQQTQVAASASTPVAGPSRSNVQQLSEAGPSRPSFKQPALPSNIEAWQNKQMAQVAPYIVANDKPDTNQVWLSAASGSQAEEAAPPQVSSIPIEFPSTSQPVKWECRAPLPSGRLCPRMDRYKCPLHGRVVPRDELGRCSRPEDARAEEERRLLHQQQHPDWQDPKLLAELEKQTGIDLKMPVKGQHKKKRPEFPGLTDLKRKSDSPRERLAKKLFKK